MPNHDDAVDCARRATTALRELDTAGATADPDCADRFAWSADVLDELARAVEIIGGIVEEDGDDGVDVRARADELSRAIVRHRNGLLAGERAPTRPRVRDERPAGPCPPPAVREPGPTSLVWRLMAEEWAEHLGSPPRR